MCLVALICYWKFLPDTFEYLLELGLSLSPLKGLVFLGFSIRLFFIPFRFSDVESILGNFFIKEGSILLLGGGVICTA